jgi:hypothetical protein
MNEVADDNGPQGLAKLGLLITLWMALQTAGTGVRLVFAEAPPAWSLGPLGPDLVGISHGAAAVLLVWTRLAGAGLSAAGLFMLVIALGPGWRGATWARWAPPAVGLLLYLTVTVVLVGLEQAADTRTPVLPAAVSAGVCALGMLLAALPAKARRREGEPPRRSVDDLYGS